MKNTLLTLSFSLFFMAAFAQGVQQLNWYSFGHNTGEGYDVLMLANGEQMVTGGSLGRVIMKRDNQGYKKWSRSYWQSGGYMGFGKMLPCSGSTFIVQGVATTTAVYASCIFVAKADTAGNILWAKKMYRGTDTRFQKMIMTSDHHMMVLITDTNRTLLVKMDTSGNIIWSKQYYELNGIQGIVGYDIVQLPNGTFVISGTCSGLMVSFTPGLYPLYNAICIFKVDTAGNYLSGKMLLKSQINSNVGYVLLGGAHYYSVGTNLFRCSDNSYILRILSGFYNSYGGGTAFLWRLDSNFIATSHMSYNTQAPMSVLSEYPTGRLNIFQYGGSDGEYGTPVHPLLIRSNLALGNTQTVQYFATAPSGWGHITFDDAHRLADGSFIATGTHPANNQLLVMKTDTAGWEACVAQPYTLPPPVADTSLKTYPLTGIYADTGITVQALSLLDSAISSVHCDCDSLPVAKFGVTLSGYTASFHDSSTNTLTWSWSFGDNTPFDTNSNPVHTYTGTLHRFITLYVTNRCGFSSFKYELNPFPLAFVVDSTTCNTLCNGAMTVTPLGGTPPYMYQLGNGPFQASNTFSNLCGTSYNITIVDSNGLTAGKTVLVPAKYTVSAQAGSKNSACFGSANGKAWAQMVNGVGPYTYMWNANSTLNTDTLFNLGPGIDSVLIKDVNQCSLKQYFNLSQPPQLTVTSANNSCTLRAYPYGGTPPYRFSLTVPPVYGLPIAGYFEQLNPAPGVYTITVKDSNGCIATTTQTVTGPPQLTITDTHQDASCYNDSNGAVNVTVGGGTPVYHYSWSNMTSWDHPYMTGLHAGPVVVTVQDYHFCVIKDTIIITQPALLADSISKLDLLCYGDSVGMAIVYAYGGTSPYQYTWLTTPVQHTDTIQQLTAGNCALLITDDHGCTVTDTVSITEPTPLQTSITTTPDNGGCTGTAAVTATGGIGIYQYAWSNGPASVLTTGLCGGVLYTVTVSTTPACFVVDTVLLSFPVGIEETLSAYNITVSPNPFSDMLMVKWNNRAQLPASVNIFAANGAQVFHSNVIDKTAGKMEITTTGWAPGQYILHVVDANGISLGEWKLLKK